ncbi:lipocalin family protein [Ideonella sp. YS5]|uniref:lipocalin family protein n=1 Tax=Ideonella sp. YS5 TaxID=3453714 RepID=UPI003EEEE5B9
MDLLSSSPLTRERPPDAGELDLDERIRLAELALISRDERVSGLVSGLGQRVRRARRPARWLPPLLGGVALFLCGWWLWRRLRREPAHHHEISARPGHESRGRRSHSRFSLWEGLALAWPLLPEAWRARWGPTSTSALFNFGGALVRKVTGHERFVPPPPGPSAATSHPPVPSGSVPAAPAGPTWPPLRTVAYVDLGRYAGTWHEIARLPNPFEQPCAGQPLATYALSNRNGLAVTNRCRGADGRERLVQGEARVVPGSNGARLKVSFLPTWLRWLPFGWGDYWILHLDEGYTVALVGEPTRRSLWLLARRPHLDAETLHQLVGVARAQGFAVERLVFN